MSVRLLAAAVAALALGAGAGAANAAERFVGVDVYGNLVTFDSASGATTKTKLIGTNGIRVSGIDQLPGGRLLAFTPDGKLWDLDAVTGQMAVLYGGRPIAGGEPVEGPGYFTVTPDGTHALVGGQGKAWSIDLATGASTPVPASAYSPGDSGFGEVPSPVVDQLPDGRLVGVDATRPAVVAESASGAGLRTLGGIDFQWSGPTRFSLDPVGGTGWLVSRSSMHISRLIEVDPVTGATNAPGLILDDGIDSFVALGPEQTPGAAPIPALPGVPAPVVEGPTRFHTGVEIQVHAQSVRGIARRRGVFLQMGTAGKVGVQARVTVDGVRVCSGAISLPLHTTVRRTIRCSATGLRRIRRSAGHDAVLRFTLTDDGGSAVVTKTIRLGR